MKDTQAPKLDIDRKTFFLTTTQKKKTKEYINRFDYFKYF